MNICSGYNFTVTQGRVINGVLVADLLVVVFSCLLAIALILATKSFKDFIIRLIVYLSIAAIIHSVAYLLFNFYYGTTEWTRVWQIAQVPLFLVTCYSLLVYGLLLCWMGLYVLTLSLCGGRLKKVKYEIIGVFTVLLSPLVAVWAIPVFYTRECLYSDSSLLLICGFIIPFSLFTLVSTATISAVIFTLCKGAFVGSRETHKKAVMKLAPFLGFFVLQNLYGIPQVLSRFFSDQFSVNMFIYSLYPLTFLSLPFLLLYQPRVRQKLRHKRRKEETNLQQQYQTSQTHFIVPPETSLTEQEPLIIRQSK